jgi:hypothetical protein
MTRKTKDTDARLKAATKKFVRRRKKSKSDTYMILFITANKKDGFTLASNTNDGGDWLELPKPLANMLGPAIAHLVGKAYLGLDSVWEAEHGKGA